jgi:hypothetical protein
MDAQTTQSDAPKCPQTPPKKRVGTRLTRDQKIQIRALLAAGLPYSKIQEVLDVTIGQICYTKNSPATPRHNRSGRKCKNL